MSLRERRQRVVKALAELEKVNENNKGRNETAEYLRANKKVDDAVRAMPRGLRARSLYP